MKSAALLATAIALAGCGRHYADFTLPPLAGGDPTLTFAFDEYPEPVLSNPEGDALNPSVVESSARLWNLYSVFNGKFWATVSASSGDKGLHWGAPQTVLTPVAQSWEGRYIVANGSAFAAQEGLLYWYVGGPRNAGSIGLARRDVGGVWRREARPVLGPGPFESWDERAAADPYVIRPAVSGDASYYMYYLGHDRAQPPQQRIGVARSSDGIHWTKLIANPIVSPGPPGSFDEAGVGEPAVWQWRNFYWMLFTGRDISERRRLGLARSTDGIHWVKLSAVFSGASAWDSKVICDPTVLLDGDQIKVWFGGGDVASPDENLHGKIGYATLRPIHMEAK